MSVPHVQRSFSLLFSAPRQHSILRWVLEGDGLSGSHVQAPQRCTLLPRVSLHLLLCATAGPNCSYFFQEEALKMAEACLSLQCEVCDQPACAPILGSYHLRLHGNTCPHLTVVTHVHT